MAKWAHNGQGRNGRQNLPWIVSAVATAVAVSVGLFGGGRCAPMLDIQTTEQAHIEHDTIRAETTMQIERVTSQIEDVDAKQDVARDAQHQIIESLGKVQTDLGWIKRNMRNGGWDD